MAPERGPLTSKPAGRPFQIKQRQDPGGYLRLILLGELDLPGVPKLKSALLQLRHESERIRLDLAQLEFIDSTGINALILALRDARSDGWQLEIDPDVSAPVKRVIDVAGVGPFIWPANGG